MSLSTPHAPEPTTPRSPYARRSRPGRALDPGDGRIARSRQTRQVIIDGFLLLAGRLGRAPSVKELSAVSGRSMRIIFDRFPSLDILAAEAVQQLLMPSVHDVLHRVAGLDREGRIAFHVEARRHACERLRPAWPIVTERVRKDPACAAQLGLLQRIERERMAALYAPEFRGLGEAERDRRLLALDILLGIETWICLRERHLLNIEAAVEFWRAGVRRLLAD